ncbi:MAG: alkyl hydroperoxide reductase [Chloroflexi bacterium]|nr:alkyl hydroperoxide reductase [Chloroflexota bacterium]
MVPQLRRLEHHYQQELVVIGVHSPKFSGERETEAVRKAVLRYGISHPVINDRDHRVWSEYACRAWPSLYFLDPLGKIIGRHEGELPFETLDRILGEIVAEFQGKGLLDRRPVTWRREGEAASALSFPGAALADAASGRLFIADSGHHRILVTALDGQVTAVIGSGEPGLQDGLLASARFNSPQGMALDGRLLYVADTENHAIRRADLAQGLVETVAGTGEQAFQGNPGPARQTPLSSPWDVELVAGILYIAMAGNHQLWALDLAAQAVHPFAGNGMEGLADGPREGVCLAQPSGLASDGQRLYFTDSETSSVRVVDLGLSGRVETFVGRGLFEFGDQDGVGEGVRLQHPLGLCWHDGALYVADTYNHRVKRLDPRTRACATFLGSGQPGPLDGKGVEARFRHPSDLSVAKGVLYIADTDNHALRAADLATGEVRTIRVRPDGGQTENGIP